MIEPIKDSLISLGWTFFLIIIVLFILYRMGNEQIFIFLEKHSRRKICSDNLLETKADMFENNVALKIASNNDVYKVYNNLYFHTDLRIENGEVSSGTIVQQDIIAVTKFGIVAVECKNYEGVVTMSTGPKWYRDGQPFQNPVNQNQNHIEILKKISGKANMPVFNAVIFSDDVINLAAIHGEENEVLNKYPYIGRCTNTNKVFDCIKKDSNITITKKEAKKYHKLFTNYMFPDKRIKQAQLLYAMKQEAINH